MASPTAGRGRGEEDGEGERVERSAAPLLPALGGVDGGFNSDFFFSFFFLSPLVFSASFSSAASFAAFFAAFLRRLRPALSRSAPLDASSAERFFFFKSLPSSSFELAAAGADASAAFAAAAFLAALRAAFLSALADERSASVRLDILAGCRGNEKWGRGERERGEGR